LTTAYTFTQTAGLTYEQFTQAEIFRRPPGQGADPGKWNRDKKNDL